MPWLHCQKIAGLEYLVQLLFNFTSLNVRQVQIGPYASINLLNYKRLGLTLTICVCVLPGSFRGMGAFYFKIEIEKTSLTQHC